MQTASRRYGDVVVASPSGRVDHANAEQLSAALTPLIESGAPLALDFSGVDYISSVGLRALMMAAKAIRARGGPTLVVASPQPVVREIFEISRFGMILDIVPTLRAGLEKMSAEAVAAYDAAGGA